METKDVDYIATHYREGRFDTKEGWNRLGIAPVSLWKRYRAAAAISAAVVISATAAVIYHEYGTNDKPQQAIEVSAPETPVNNPLAEIKVIDFEDASLNYVVKKIETVYNVKVENLPVHADEYQLSLHYEGTPTDLIDVINDLLGTQMTVTEK